MSETIIESDFTGTLTEIKEDDETSGPTVAKAIQSRRAAMFYGRFKRSKDTSNYSTEDLSCILGGKERRPKRLLEDDEPPTPSVTVRGHFRY